MRVVAVRSHRVGRAIKNFLSLPIERKKERKQTGPVSRDPHSVPAHPLSEVVSMDGSLVLGFLAALYFSTKRKT